jgi:hypothetical protein
MHSIAAPAPTCVLLQEAIAEIVVEDLETARFCYGVSEILHEDLHLTACTVVQCSVMDDSAFLWEHAIFGPPPHRNPLTDRYEILHN